MPAAVVFVANGAGDSRSLSQNLVQVVQETSAPLQVETVHWSLGPRRVVADQVDHNNHLSRGRELALQADRYRRSYPDRRIYFTGHSAGCAVVLAAAEALPADSVDGIILLAPAVSPKYNLRSALRATRCSLDVFYSKRDRWVLGMGMAIVGTTEGDSNRAAGQYGFKPDITEPGDAVLYAKLRQHPWDPALEWSGHNGGHHGYQVGFLRAYILPILLANRS
jgi:pimeloyl-ACP methyl ester carboxylesterase